jgi:DNA-directed RNA polymerase specialized sigma24 family protein
VSSDSDTIEYVAPPGEPGSRIPKPTALRALKSNPAQSASGKYTPEFKAEVALEALSDITFQELAEKRGIDVSEVELWTNHLLENADKLFVDESNSKNE